MHRHPGWWLFLVLWLVTSGWMGAVGAQTDTGALDEPALAVIADGPVSRAVGATLSQEDELVRITVEGLAFPDITAWTAEGQDLTGALAAAVAEGTATVQETAAGFALTWTDPPAAWTGRLDLETRAGVALTAVPLTCPAATAFGAATSPVLAADTACRYGSNTCSGNPRRHTGIDFPGSGNAIALAAGTVVRKETLSTGDHGLGNNLILRHLLPGPNCAYVYSSYAHLASINTAISVGQAVTKGQTLGVIGRSGFGKPNYWSKAHLHLELKSAAVTGNPLGVGKQTTTCATDPLNAKANTCWLYVAKAAAPTTAPDDSGYLDPAGFLNKTLTAPVYRQVSAGAYHTCAIKTDNTLACWGDNYYGQAIPPAGTFKQVSAGGSYNLSHNSDNKTANTLAY